MQNQRTQLLEGGNVFKNENGELTRRINRDEIPTTIKFLEILTGLDFSKDKAEDGLPAKWLGTTGRKSSSGDLDLAVDDKTVTKEQLTATLADWLRGQNVPEDQIFNRARSKAAPAKTDGYIWGTGDSVHFRTPINGNAKNGFVQTDFMFGDPQWQAFAMKGGREGSTLTGMSRHIILASIVSVLNPKYKWSYKFGIVDRATNQPVEGGRDPQLLSKLTGIPIAKLGNADDIIDAIKNRADYEHLVAPARETLARDGIQLPESMSETLDVYTEVNYMARLRDRIVNQGMTPIFEEEAPAPAPVTGGAAKGIEHLEDLVFRKGSRGIEEALAIINHAATDTESTSVKWDGSPALIFGRRPQDGKFVLTDIAGWEAKGYDGMATSYEMMAQIQSQRKGDRTELLQKYKTLFPALEAALPPGFRGYLKGDLLYTQRPPVQDGRFVFQPNTQEYRIPVDSALGKRIQQSVVALGMHSYYEDRGAARQAISKDTLANLKPVRGLLLIEPIFGKTPAPKVSLEGIDTASIDRVFNPGELRARQITDLPVLCVNYINYRVKKVGHYTSLAKDFGQWLKGASGLSPRKLNNIMTWLSENNNALGLKNAFTAFLKLHKLKMQVLGTLDKQHPGQEGWVMTTPQGTAKAVNRFDFTARNQAKNNPTQ